MVGSNSFPTHLSLSLSLSPSAKLMILRSRKIIQEKETGSNVQKEIYLLGKDILPLKTSVSSSYKNRG
jgi:hypothetical protein